MTKAVSSMTKPNSKQEAKSPETSPSRLLALAQEGAGLACLVAANEACPPDLLRSLAEHKDAKVRQRVVANPQTPAEVAAKLGSQFPEHLLDNPAFDIYLLERPDLLEGIGASALRSLVKRDSCPVGFLEYAAGFDDKATQLSVLTNPATPLMAVERLLQSAHPSVKEAAQWHVNLQPKPTKDWKGSFAASVERSMAEQQPNEGLNELAYVIATTLVEQGRYWPEDANEGDILKFRTPGFEVVILANNRSTPPSVLEHLLVEQDMRERMEISEYDFETIFHNPSIPASVLQFGAEDKNKSVRYYCAGNSRTSDELLGKLAVDKHELVRIGVAQNSSTPARYLARLADDPEDDVRVAVAANPSSPPSVLERLAKDGNDRVRQNIAANPSSPASVLELLAEEEMEMKVTHFYYPFNTPARCLVAANPSTQLPVFERLAADKEMRVRKYVAANVSAPSSVLERLAGDKHGEVRESVAMNPSSPASVLRSLAADKRVGVRSCVAGNPSSPASALRSLAADKSEYVRLRAAANRDTPALALQILAHDTKLSVRRGVAENTSTPSSVLEELSRDQNSSVRMAVADHPTTAAQVLQDLAYDNDFLVRAKVAARHSTPVPLLEILAQDKNMTVRAGAASNPYTPLYLLARLMCDAFAVRNKIASMKSAPVLVLQRLLMVSTQTEPDRKWMGSERVPELKRRVAKCISGQDPVADLMALRAEYLEKLTSATTPSTSRLLGLRLPDCPAATLAKAQRSADWRERCAIASNPNSPLSVVQRLAEDGNVLVRAAALERLNAKDL